MDLPFQIVAPLLVLQDFVLQTTHQYCLVLLCQLVGVQPTTIVVCLVLQPHSQVLVLLDQTGRSGADGFTVRRC